MTRPHPRTYIIASAAVPVPLHRVLQALAQRDGVSLSAMLRRLIDAGLASEKDRDAT